MATEILFADVIDPEILLKAYASGIFPMSMDEGEIGWFSPDPRGVIPIEEFHVPHGLKRALRKEPFEIRFNYGFADVMRGCAERDSTWISEDIIASYCELHDWGCAHSVECWKDDDLVGGLYGVSLGGAFFGESMFSRATDSSKIALVALVERLREREFVLLDSQWSTEHLRQFGCFDMPRDEYLDQLGGALLLDVEFD